MTVEEIRKYRTSLYGTLTTNIESFEKNSILLSTGILAFSITFIKDIVKIETAVFLWLLFVSWALIIISISLMIVYFLSSAAGSNKIWKIVDDYLTDNKKFNSLDPVPDEEVYVLKLETNKALENVKKRTARLRIWSLWLFFSGVVMLSLFVSLNLIQENRKDNTVTITNKTKSIIHIKTARFDTTFSDSIIKVPLKSL